MTNEGLIQALRVCYNGKGTCSGCPLYNPNHPSTRRGCDRAEIVRLAADRLEALTDQLHYAQAERDVVTKRMIAMEIERAGT